MARGGVDKRGEAWRARYRHPETGKQHQRTFARQVDAQRWLRDQLGTIDSGRWVDPQAGRLTFVAYYTEWSRRQVWEEGRGWRCSWRFGRRRSPIWSSAESGPATSSSGSSTCRPAWRRRPSRLGSSRSARYSGRRSGTRSHRGGPDRGCPAPPPAQTRRSDADPHTGAGSGHPRGGRRTVPPACRRVRVRRAEARRGSGPAGRRRGLPEAPDHGLTAGPAGRRRQRGTSPPQVRQ
jgi:hypothetical protein